MGTFNVELPNGTVVEGIPEGTDKDTVMRKAISGGFATAEDFGTTTSELDLEYKALRDGLMAEVLPKKVMTDEEVAAQELALGQDTKAEMVPMAIRNVLDMPTFGFADEIEAGYKSVMNGTTFGDEMEVLRLEKKAFEQAHPQDAAMAKLAGAPLMPMPKLGMIEGTVARTAAESGLGMGLYGVGSTEGDVGNRLITGGVYAIGGALLGGGIGAGLDKAFGSKAYALGQRAVREPTIKNIEAYKNEMYGKVPMKFKAIDAKDAKGLQAEVNTMLKDADYIRYKGETTPVDKVVDIINRRGELSLGQYDKLRQTMFKYVDKSREGQIVRDIITKFDDFVDGKMAASGDKTLLKAREANQFYKRAQVLDEGFNKVRIDMKDAGKNVDPFTAYRKVASDILKNKDKSRWFREEDIKLLEGFVQGSVPERVAQQLSRVAPSSRTMMSTGGLLTAIYTADPLAVTFLAATEGAKLFKNQAVTKQAKELVLKMGGFKKVQKMVEGGNTEKIAGVLGRMSFDQTMDLLFPDMKKDMVSELGLEAYRK